VYELMAQLAAYSGLRWGELAALTVGQVDQVGRVITVDRKVIEIRGQLYEEAPKNRKRRRTIYPAGPRRGTRWPNVSPPASGPRAASKKPGPTRWG
jgi:integrase